METKAYCGPFPWTSHPPDIQRFTNDNRESTVQAINTTFRQLIEGTKQFIIPVFQRDYAWETANWQQLWNDISRVSTGSGDRGHFIGSVVHIPDRVVASRPSHMVIDGQQRLTTLVVLCVALRDHIRNANGNGSEGLPTPEQLDAYFISNTLETGDFRYKLRLRDADDETIRALADGGSFNELGNRKSVRIVDAYQYFRDKLKEDSTNVAAIYRGVSELRIVEISLERSMDDPQGVFESINSTGVRLTQGDLVRNYLLMGLEETEQTRLYRSHWQRIEAYFRGDNGVIDDAAMNLFLRDYIALKEGATRESQIPRIYHEFKEYRERTASEVPLEKLLSDIRRFAGYYAAWRGREDMPTERLSQAMHNVRSRGNTTGVLVMRLFECYEDSRLSTGDFLMALRLIDSYLLRHAVCGNNIRSFWRIFAEMNLDIQHNDPSNSLHHTMAKERGNYGRWSFPSDGDFARKLQEVDLYHLQICRHILDRLENDGEKEPSPVGDYSIEHIMPQDLTAEWREMLGEEEADQVHQEKLHRLGNLTLTGFNSQYSNSPFLVKKTIKNGFNESAVRLNLYVRSQSTWTVAQIEERGQILAQRATSIWPRPKEA